VLGASFFLVACTDGPTAAAPAVDAGADGAATEYIVLLRDTSSDAGVVAARLARSLPSLRTTSVTVPGINARIVSDEVPVEVLSELHAAVLRVDAADAARLRADPAVAVVEPVRAMRMSAVTTPVTTSWALDRINQVALPLDGKMTRFGGDGRGVRIAIFDTGIRWTHADLAGRVALGYDAFTATAKRSGDAQGHGTFVASLAAGTQSGTAPAATLLDVRVLNASGAGSSLELSRGVDWVLAEKKRVAGPMVANMSLGFAGGSAFVDAAVDRLRAAGIVVVVAAGNSRADACLTSPARAPGAITVGATTRGTADSRAAFSNGGKCVDLSAPGEAVPGAGSTGDLAGVQGSGTSMASPYVAGAAAVYLAANATATPDAVANWLIAESGKNLISGLLPETPNRLLSLTRLPTASAAPVPAPTPAPTPTPAPVPAPATGATVSLTSTCTARTCILDAGVPTGVSATEAPTITYTWNIGPMATITGTNLRRQTITFGAPTSVDVTVTARRGGTTIARATVRVAVK
jgi:subtilisin family serine protease